MASRNYIKKNFIGTTLRRTIESLNTGRPIIYGSLRVTAGHDYWWFLEYGTGDHFGDDMAIDDQSIPINPPDSVEGYLSEGSYDITVKDQPMLVYISRFGTLHTQKDTHHPGAKPLAIVRTSLFAAHLYLKEAVQGRTAGRRRKAWKLLTRKELVDMVNDTMQELLLQLQIATPSGDANDPNVYHQGRHTPLADAWRVTKAR